MKHVIIGAGAAGISAIKTIRALKSEDEIVLISSDESVYSRCMLHKYIAGERDEKTLSYLPDHFFSDNHIRHLSGVTVTDIHTNERVVCFEGGSETYDKLLIATGTESIIPPIGGLRGAPNVYGLRSLSDAKAIRARAMNAQRIIIIGAGLVGLDAAYGLLALKKAPAVIEMAQSILAMNLDRHAAGVYQQKFEEAGCAFHLGRKVSGTGNDASGAVNKVILESGEELPCDMVIVAVGVRAAIGFLSGSAIACERHIIVNPYLSTNVDGVYAAGDVAGLSAIWPNAVAQGGVAAKNMCGIETAYDDTFADKNTVNFFGLPSLSLGKLEPGEDDRVYVCESANRYEKIITNNGNVVGVQLQGDISGGGFWQHMIKHKVDVSRINKSVPDLAYADFYGMDADGSYVWAASS